MQNCNFQTLVSNWISTGISTKKKLRTELQPEFQPKDFQPILNATLNETLKPIFEFQFPGRELLPYTWASPPVDRVTETVF